MTAVALEGTPARARTAWLIPGLLMLVVGVVGWWASVPYVVGVFHDDGVYALLARAIASGQGFHYLQLPGEPAAIHYPPLYPLALGLLWRLSPAFPENIPLLLGLNVACMAAAALGIHHLARRRLGWSPEPAALTALGATIGTPVLLLASALFSEPLFLAMLPVVLLLAERAVDERDRGAAVMAGAAIGLLMLLRTHAVALLGATVIMLAVRREWRRALIVAGCAVAVQLPWLIWSRQATPLVAPPLRGAYGAYGAWLGDGVRDGGIALLVATVRTNVRELWLLLGDRTVPGTPAWLGVPALALLAALLIYGGVRALRRVPVMVLFVVFYLGIVMVFAFVPWRYVWGIWPLCVLLAVVGAEGIVARARSTPLRMAALVAITIPFAAMIRTEMRAYSAREWTRPAHGAGMQAAQIVEWVRRNTLPSDIVLAECAETVTLFTGRRAAPPVPSTALEYVVRRTPDEERRELAGMLAVVPARYVVSLSPEIQRAGRELAGARPGLREIATVPGAVVFEVMR